MDKAEIRDRARVLFEKLSFAKTSVADIARSCGLGKGTVYLYFQSKDEIFFSIMEERINRLVEARSAFVADPAIDLRTKFRSFFEDLVDEYFTIKDLMFGSFENVQGAMLKDVFVKYGRYYEWSVDMLHKLVAAHEPYGRRDPAELRATLAQLMELVIGRIILFLVIRDWNDKEGLKAMIAPLSIKLFDAFVA